MANEGSNEEITKELRDLAFREIMHVVTRVMEAVSRYFQFRLRELIVRGFKFNYSFDTKMEGNDMILVLKVNVPEWFVYEYARNYSYFTKIFRKLRRSAGIVDRYKYIKGAERDTFLLEMRAIEDAGMGEDREGVEIVEGDKDSGSRKSVRGSGEN